MLVEKNRRVAEFAESLIEKQSIPYPHYIAKSQIFIPAVIIWPRIMYILSLKYFNINYLPHQHYYYLD